MPSRGSGGEVSAIPKLGSVFRWTSLTSRQLPVRRPTALSPLSGYGDLYQMDIDGELHSPEIRLDGLVAKFVDGEWLTYGTGAGGTAPRHQKGTSNHDNGRSEQNGSPKEELEAVRSENNFLKLRNEALLDMLTEVVAEIHLRDEESKSSSS